MKRTLFLTLSLVVVTSLLTGCANMNRSQQGALLGTLGGAAVGSQLGPDDDRHSNALIGAGLGALTGYIVGNEMDKHDQAKVGRTLENSKSGQTTEWTNPDTGKHFEVTPRQPYQTNENETVYRDVIIETTVNGEKKRVKAKAKRNPDGTWTVIE